MTRNPTSKFPNLRQLKLLNSDILNNLRVTRIWVKLLANKHGCLASLKIATIGLNLDFEQTANIQIIYFRARHVNEMKPPAEIIIINSALTNQKL